MNYVFLGPPGAGKGTMAGMLSEKTGHVHISTGDILRAEMAAESELGRQARAYVDNGDLVPDDLVAAIVEQALARDEVAAHGFILDGYPRTVHQADLLEAALGALPFGLDTVVLFEVERDLLLSRLTARRVCADCRAVYNVLYNPPKVEGVCDVCGGPLRQRSDDSRETALERLDVYRKQTAPLIEYYDHRDLLLRVNGGLSKDENFRVLCEALGI